MKKQITFILSTDDELYIRFINYVNKYNQKISGVIKNALKLYLDTIEDKRDVK